jgi:hypothetical protein
MNKKLFKNLFVLSAVSAVLLSSCIKDDVKELGDAGRTFIKFLEAPENKLFFEPFTETRNISLISVRRDANSSAELNKPVTVNLTLDTAAISAYNDANNETFELLPDSLFAIVGSGITKTGDLTYQVTFNPGEAAKEFMIGLNGAKWDLSRKYAMPFTIADPGGLAVSSERGEAMTFISIKNKWDGTYEVTGTMVDNANATLTGYYPLEWDLVTSGPNQVIVFDNVYLGTPGHIINAGGSLSYYGSFGLVVNIDPATNKITSVTNYYGQPAGNTRSAELDPTGLNYYDADTKTFYIKYFMMQPSVVPTGPRVAFDEVWKFTGPR